MRSISNVALLICVFVVTGCSVQASGSARSSARSTSSSSSGSSTAASPAPERRAPAATATPAPAPEPAPIAEPEPEVPQLAETPAIKCAGREVIELSGVAIDGGAKPAIQASGQCRVTIEGCSLTSSGVVVSAAGKAQVSLRDCDVSGGEKAIEAAGNGVVRLEGGTLEGAAVAKGKGVVEHDGASVASR